MDKGIGNLYNRIRAIGKDIAAPQLMVEAAGVRKQLPLWTEFVPER